MLITINFSTMWFAITCSGWFGLLEQTITSETPGSGRSKFIRCSLLMMVRVNGATSTTGPLLDLIIFRTLGLKNGLDP